MRSRRHADAIEVAVPTESNAETAGQEPVLVATRAGEPRAVTREQGLITMAQAYRQLTATVAERSDADLMLPTRCTGWAVIDVLYHVLLDAQRALVALATPEERLCDVDYITYWRAFSGPTNPSAAGHAHAVRVAASAFRSRTVVQLWEETSEAAIRAARACPSDSNLGTQHHILTLPDLLGTLAVEAAVHTLDLTPALPDVPEPDPEQLALVVRTLDGLLGAGMPRPDWGDVEYVLKGVGRLPLEPAEREILGPMADRFPLFG